MARVIIMFVLVVTTSNFLLAPIVSSYFSFSNKIMRRLTLIPPMAILGGISMLIYEVVIKSIKDVWKD
jgi:hypothetical protein